MPSKAERLVSHDSIAVLDTAKYDQMWRVATAIAQSALVPESLRGYYEGKGDARKFIAWPTHTVVANCFKVVNQAVRWKMDPFALIDCASIIHGRLCWEGKVIAAVLDSLASITLRYIYEGTGEMMKVKVVGMVDGALEEVTGTVAQWKTTGTNSPWSKPADYKRQLAYRGAREWARRHKPAVMLGVYGTDEVTVSGEPIDITPKPKPPAAPPPRRGAPKVIEQAPEQEQSPPETVNTKEPAQPPPQRSKPVPIRGKSNKPAKEGYEDIPEEEAHWLQLFEMDLKECRNVKAVNMLVDRREKAIDHLSPKGKAKSTEIVNLVLSEIQR